jgi:hypothetical protein
MKFRSVLVASMLLSASALSANAACTTDTPLSLFGNDGAGNGLLSNQGGDINNLPTDLLNNPGPNILNNGGVVGQIAGQNIDGGGVAHLNGSADCSAQFARLSREIEEAQFDTAALAAALSAPAWLEPNEKFSLSLGAGFADGSTAFGGTALMRFDGTWSGFAGGALSGSNSDLWAAKVGLRAGF